MDWQAAAVEAGRIAQAWTAEGGPGGAVLLFDADDLRAQACGGLANLELALPFQADTAVRYASLSKHFLAACLLRAGEPRLDDYLGTHLALPPALGAVTVGRALDMTSGLPDALESLWLLGVPPGTPLGEPALLAFLRRLEGLNFAPGSEISYSNTGYRLVQAALEAKRDGYGTVLRERFFRPLGLGIRLPADEAEPVPQLAGGYWKSPSGWRCGRYGLHYSAAAGLAGSAQDLASWLQALLGGRAPADGLLSRLGRLRTLADGRTTGYGLGLARQALGSRILVGHGGALAGFRNQFLLDPQAGAGVLVVSNREDTDAATLALRVMAALHRTKLPEPARGVLPEGLYAMPGTPFWLEHAGGVVTFMGASGTVYPDDEGVAGGSAHLPIRLRQENGAISGEIGHVPRRFVPVPAGLAPEPGWAGGWVCPAQNARFDVAVANGQARLTIGTGPLRTELKLRPIGEGRALTERGGDGPWTQRACVQFGRDEARLVTAGSRVLRFVRV